MVIGTPATRRRLEAVGNGRVVEGGFLATVEAATHTTLGPNNACIEAAIDAYLVDLVVPEGELTC